MCNNNEHDIILIVKLKLAIEVGSDDMSFNLKYDQGRIRKYHYFMLLSLIQKEKQVSRAQLAKLTKMSNTSVGKIIKELIDDDLVIEVGQTVGGVGRKATLLELNPQGSYIIGVEIQHSMIRIANVSLNGKIIDKRVLNFDIEQRAEVILDMLAKEIELMIDQLVPEISKKILAIGISIPGLVTWPDGKTLAVPQLHWNDVEIKSLLEDKLDYFIYVDNDVRAVLLAESLFGSLTQYKDVACIYIGSGVGGAVMLNNEILRGHSNTLGEIGHITMNPDGSLCDCGRLGCLQTYICSSELQKQTGKSIHEIFEAFENQEEWAVKIINRAKKYLSLAIANIVVMYNPKAILLSGPMVQDFPLLIEGITDSFREYIWTPLEDSLDIKLSIMGKDNGVIGASALVLNEFLRHSNDDI